MTTPKPYTLEDAKAVSFLDGDYHRLVATISALAAAEARLAELEPLDRAGHYWKGNHDREKELRVAAEARVKELETRVASWVSGAQEHAARAEKAEAERDAERARSARLEAAVDEYLCGRSGFKTLAVAFAALAASPVEPAKCCSHSAAAHHAAGCYGTASPKEACACRGLAPVEPDDFAMRVAEAVREACAACWGLDGGGGDRIRAMDLATIVAGVKP